MKAVLYDRFGRLPIVTDVPDPVPASHGIVVKVVASGICRSDWHGWMGHDSDIVLPHVPGHELAGTVEMVGRDVTRWLKGDRVTVPFVAGCGRCEECSSGNQQVCRNQFQPGFTAWGSFAEFVAIDHADVNVVRVPEAIGLDTAASLGCRFATSFRAVVDQGRIRPGEWLAVHGCGGVGLSAIMIAHSMGARIVAVDIRMQSMTLARSLGADGIVLVEPGMDVVQAIRDMTGGGAHMSIDALGSAATCWNSVACLRTRGRHVQVGLLAGSESDPPVPMGLVISRELRLIGSHGMQAHRYDLMLDLILSGRVSPDRLIDARLPLSAAPAALVEMDRFSGSGIRMITDFAH